MAILGNEKRIADVMWGSLVAGITRKSVEERFRRYVAAEHLQQKVGKTQMRSLFKIVDEFWRVRIATEGCQRTTTASRTTVHACN